MTRNEARDELKRIVPCTKYLQKARKGGYICPNCKSGSGENNGKYTGALHYYPETNTVYCFNCEWSGDPLDLYGIQNGTDYNNTLSLMAKENGIEITNTPSDAPERLYSGFNMKGDNMSDKTTETATEATENVKTDFTAYYDSLKGNLRNSIDAITYLEEFRGIPVDLAEKYGVLFDPEADPANAPGGIGTKKYPTGRIILPSCKTHYATRAIDLDVDEQFQKLNAKDSKPYVTNAWDIYNKENKPVFVTEGMFDMLSIIAVGGHAVALNSTENWKKLADGMKTRPTDNVLIISLDNDPAGKKATDALDAALNESGTKHIIYNVSGLKNDANALYRVDREKFTDNVNAAIRQAAKVTAGPFWSVKVGDYITKGGFTADIDYFKKYRERKTGFENIDHYLTLYPGLAALGGAASLGKTTFCINLCDNLLDQGETIMYFSLEQEPIELVTKLLARRLSQRVPNTPIHNTDIKNGATSADLECIKQEYAQIADRFIIVRGNFSITAQEIRDYVETFIQQTGIRPVVVVDYLQLVSPPTDFRGDTRAMTDQNIKTFKAMQTDNELLLILVSNFNRSGYDVPVSYSAFKETGMIEYTCDYIWGLQLAVLDTPEFYTKTGPKGGAVATNEKERSDMVDQAINSDPKQVEFVSLKSRNGKQSYKCLFNYYMADDLYEPVKDDTDQYLNNPGWDWTKDPDPDYADLADDPADDWDQMTFDWDDDEIPFD